MNICWSLSVRVVVMLWPDTNRPFGYEKVYLPLRKLTDTPFHIQGDELFRVHVEYSYALYDAQENMVIVLVENVFYYYPQLEYSIFPHLKVWVAAASHNFKLTSSFKVLTLTARGSTLDVRIWRL